MDFEQSVRQALDDLRDRIPDLDQPDWEPLERALPIEHCAGFMWMGRDPGGAAINVYKHGITRRYLHLAIHPQDGLCAYRYVGDGYVETSLEEAIAEAFAGIEEAPWVQRDDPRATPYDDEYRARKDRALADAGYKVMRLRE